MYLIHLVRASRCFAHVSMFVCGWGFSVCLGARICAPAFLRASQLTWGNQTDSLASICRHTPLTLLLAFQICVCLSTNVRATEVHMLTNMCVTIHVTTYTQTNTATALAISHPCCCLACPCPAVNFILDRHAIASRLMSCILIASYESLQSNQLFT
jgi:hypothetical protein